MKRVFACAIVLSVVVAATLSADVKTQQKNQVKFSGALGTVVGLFGGKAAREGVVETVAVSGNRKMTTTENSGQIIDLAEEKVYDLDLRNKTYKVTTFDEIRRKMQEAQDKADKTAERSEQRKSDRPQKEYQIDVDSKNTGQTRTINSFACRETITTITVHEKGKTLEESGGIVMTADSWLTPTVPGASEVLEFDRRYAEKLMGIDPQVAAEQMAAALAMYPGFKEAMGKMRGAKIDGTPILTTTTVENVKSAEQVASEQKTSSEQPAASGGLGGMLGRRLVRKKDDQQGGDKSRSTFMTMNHEVLSLSTSVDPSAVALPAGFRQK